MSTHDLGALPGGDLVMQGLRDLHAGAETAAALLVEIARPRLEAAGVKVPRSEAGRTDAELRLYAQLVADGADDPYGRYNSMLRRLQSCEAALEQPLGAALRGRVNRP